MRVCVWVLRRNCPFDNLSVRRPQNIPLLLLDYVSCTPELSPKRARTHRRTQSLQDERSALALPRGDKGRSVLQQPAQVIKGLAKEKQEKYSCREYKQAQGKTNTLQEKTCLLPLTDYLLRPHRGGA